MGFTPLPRLSSLLIRCFRFILFLCLSMFMAFKVLSADVVFKQINCLFVQLAKREKKKREKINKGIKKEIVNKCT